MIRIERLSKSFDALVAVDDVSFDVAEGEIFGLLGPNGAGKTTTINMICGVLKPDGGRVLIGGKDIWLTPKVVKRSLGVVPQEISVYEDLTARDKTKIHSTRHFLLERLYGLMQRDRPGPYGQMEMIGKQTPREYRQPVPLDYIAERPGKPVHHDPAGCIGDIPRLLRRYDPTQASPLPLSD